jgi:hypothetical protein
MMRGTHTFECMREHCIRACYCGDRQLSLCILLPAACCMHFKCTAACTVGYLCGTAVRFVTSVKPVVNATMLHSLEVVVLSYERISCVVLILQASPAVTSTVSISSAFDRTTMYTQTL